MFFNKKYKEKINALELALIGKEQEIERLRNENKELRSQMEGEHPISQYCTVCVHGINEYGYRMCDLECKCKGFERSTCL